MCSPSPSLNCYRIIPMRKIILIFPVCLPIILYCVMNASGWPNIFCIVIFVTCPFKGTSIIASETAAAAVYVYEIELAATSRDRWAFWRKKKSLQLYPLLNGTTTRVGYPVCLRTRKFETNQSIMIQTRKIKRWENHPR